MNCVNITLTKEQASVLIQLIDIAVQARGLQVAKAGVVLSEKINIAIQHSPSPTTPG